MWTSWSLLSGASALLSYVDPGIVSTAVQAAFIFLFGAMTAYLTAPWRWLVSLLPGRRAAAEACDQSDAPADPATETPPQRRRAA